MSKHLREEDLLLEERRRREAEVLANSEQRIKEDPFFAELVRLNSITSQVNGQLMDLIYSLKLAVDQLTEDNDGN